MILKNKKNENDAKNNVIIQVSKFELKNCKISQGFLKDFIKDCKKNTQFFRIKHTKSRDFEEKIDKSEFKIKSNKTE